MQVFFLITFIPWTVSGSECPLFMCASEKTPLDADECIRWDESSNSYLLKPCVDLTKSFCQPVLETHSNSFCDIPLPVAPSLRYPGERCRTASDCDSSKAIFGCVSGICQGQIPGGGCVDSTECNPGLYCSSKQCKSQLKVGQSGCMDDTDCTNNASCDSSQVGVLSGTCTETLSVKTGAHIKGCEGQNLVCESSVCTPGSQPTCANAMKTEKVLPVTCTSNSDCLSAEDPLTKTAYQSECKCGFNSKGEKFCGLHAGDPVGESLLKALRAWVTSDEILKCNTVRRFSSQCIEDMWGREEFLELAYFYSSYMHYSDLLYNDACVQKIYEKEYYILQTEYERSQHDKDDDNDWSYTLLPLSLYFLF